MADSLETMVARIDERTASMLAKLTLHCDQITNHEARISDLESFRNSIYIICACAVTLIGLVVAAGYFHAPV